VGCDDAHVRGGPESSTVPGRRQGRVEMIGGHE